MTDGARLSPASRPLVLPSRKEGISGFHMSKNNKSHYCRYSTELPIPPRSGLSPFGQVGSQCIHTDGLRDRRRYLRRDLARFGTRDRARRVVRRFIRLIQLSINVPPIYASRLHRSTGFLPSVNFLPQDMSRCPESSRVIKTLGKSVAPDFFWVRPV